MRFLYSLYGSAKARHAWSSVVNPPRPFQGILFLVGAALLARARRKPNARAFLNLVAVNILGNIVVGTVYSGPPADVGGPAWVHAGGAVMAIVGGTRPFSRAFGAFAAARVRVGTTPSHSGLVSSAWPAS